MRSRFARRAFAEGNWRTAVAESLLGEALTGLGQYDEAERMLREADAALKDVPGQQGREAHLTKERLAALSAARTPGRQPMHIPQDCDEVRHAASQDEQVEHPVAVAHPRVEDVEKDADRVEQAPDDQQGHSARADRVQDREEDGDRQPAHSEVQRQGQPLPPARQQELLRDSDRRERPDRREQSPSQGPRRLTSANGV